MKLKKTKIDNWYISKNYLHIDAPISFEKASEKVKDSTYVAKHAFLPFLTFDVDSIKFKKDDITGEMIPSTKSRSICYSSHLDSHIYSYYSLDLLKKYEERLKEKGLENNILAFRKIKKKDGKGKCNIDFAHQAFEDIKNFGDCAVLALDFTKFFDTLDHKVLKKQWCSILEVKSLEDDHYNIYKSLTKFSTVNKIELFKLFKISKHNPRKNSRIRICSIKEFRSNVRNNASKKYIEKNGNVGIPQGSALSGLLSNIYMLDFDEKMKKYVDNINGIYYRYCDDMLIIIPKDKIQDVEDYALEIIKELKVDINEDKTERRFFEYKNGLLTTEKHLQYLGFIFNGTNVYIRSASISRYYHKMNRGIRLAKLTRNKRNGIKKSKGLKERELYKKKIYKRYSFLGRTNFISYGIRVKKEMLSPTVKKQLKKFWNRLTKKLK